MSFSRIRKSVDLKKLKQDTKPFEEFAATADAELRDKTQAKIDAVQKGKPVPARQWLKKQDELGVWDEGNRKYSVQTPERVAGTELGRRIEAKGGGFEGLRRIVKSQSLGATKAQKVDPISKSIGSPQALTREIRGELVEEYGKSAGYPKKIISKLKTEARAGKPDTEGSKLARQLMRVRQQTDLDNVGLSKDYGQFRDAYKEHLKNALHRSDPKTVDPDIKDFFLENLDDVTEIGLEAVQKTYGRGVKGLSSYEAPTRTTTFLGTGERVARELFDLVDEAGDDIVVRGNDDQGLRELFGKTGSIFEEPLETMGAIKEEKQFVPPEDRSVQYQQETIKRMPTSAAWMDMLSALPNRRGKGTGLSFTKPHEWKKARQGADTLVKTFDDELLKELSEESAPQIFKACLLYTSPSPRDS